MPLTVALSPAEQLIVRGARPVDAVELWRSLGNLYLAHRGPALGTAVPAVNFADAVDLVNAYERLAAPLAVRLAVDQPALWLAWRRAYARVFAHAGAAPDLRAPLPRPVVLWHALLESFATHLHAFALAHPRPFHH